MGSIMLSLKEYSGKTGSFSIETLDVAPGDWATEEPNYEAVVSALLAITSGTQADKALTPERFYTPYVTPPTDANSQLGMRWDIFGTDNVNGNRYLITSAVTADGNAGGSSILLPGTDQADPADPLVAALFTALDAIGVYSPADNIITPGSWQMFLNQRRSYQRA